MTSFLGEFFIIVVLILANGIFSAAEIAIINARKSRLKPLAEAGNKAAQTALDLAGNPDQFLPTVQVGITLLNMFAAAYGGATLVDHFSAWLSNQNWAWVAAHSRSIALNLITIAIAAFSIVVGELVPKSLALRNAEKIALWSAPLMSIIASATRPVIWALGRITKLILLLLGVKGVKDQSVSLDDIEHLIDTGTAEGIVELVEQKVALGALRLGERKVRDVMRPRIDLDALDVNTPGDEVLGATVMAGFSRLPIYEGDLDHILGYVHIKDLFRQHHMGWPIDLRKMLRPAIFVPESMPLDRLLQIFQEQHNQLAIVLDEFGGTEGMVTLEDVIDELVGEIRDERLRDQTENMVQREDGSWLIDGLVPIVDLCEELDITYEEPETRSYNTVSGLILDLLGKIPAVGATAEWQGFTLEVVDMDGQRIDRVLVTPMKAKEE